LEVNQTNPAAVGQELPEEPPIIEQTEPEIKDLTGLFALHPHLEEQYKAAVNAEVMRSNAQVRKAERQRANSQNISKLPVNEQVNFLDADKRAEHFEKLYNEERNRTSRMKDVSEFTAEIHKILDTSRIPHEFFEDGLDYFAVEDFDEVRERAITFAQFEYFPKGKFEEMVNAEVDKRIKAKFKEANVESPENQPSNQQEYSLDIYEH